MNTGAVDDIGVKKVEIPEGINGRNVASDVEVYSDRRTVDQSVARSTVI